MCALDPASARANSSGRLDDCSIPAGIEDSHVAFGYLPNVGPLLPGDLILTNGRSSASTTIARAQRRLYPLAAEWTNAAIYAGDWRIIEAVPVSDIRFASLLDYVPACKLLFRRPNHVMRLEDSEARNVGLRIVAEATKRVGTARYGFVQAAKVGSSLLRGEGVPTETRDESSTERLICSQLYAKCVQIVIGEWLTAPEVLLSRDVLVSPAMLAATPKMTTLDIRWAALGAAREEERS